LLSGKPQVGDYSFKSNYSSTNLTTMDIKKKSLITGSMIAGALFATANLNANAADLFRFSNLGTGEEVRSQLLGSSSNALHLELKCGEKGKADSTAAKKGKDGKCGEGKCGEGKCGGAKKAGDKKDSAKKKGKDGKCGEGKCGN